MTASRILRRAAVAAVALLALAGCGFDVADIPLPGGADVGDDPYEVTIEFADVLDLVPQSAVRVDDIAVGRVTDVELDGWSAEVTVLVNGDVELPADAVATIRQSSLLGEKFVDLGPPADGGSGRLADGDRIALADSGRNPEVEEVLGAASLLFNGGGIEKTNTIVRELNGTLGGNEAEIKELLTTTSVFLGTLDDNKEQILTALEQVDAVARAAQDQRGAITGALDELPAALRVLDAQRDDLVALTGSLRRLGDTATGVIRESRADTIANLRALEPVLANLATASDDLVDSLSTLLTFPFADAAVGGSLAAAQAPCAVGDGDVARTPSGCGGDYLNLSINLDLSSEQLLNLLGGQGGDVPPPPAAPAPPAVPGPGAGAGDLVSFFERLFVADSAGPGPADTPVVPAVPGTTSGSADPPGAPTPTTGTPPIGGGLCGFLGLCRTGLATTPDVARLLLAPAVAP